MSVAVGLLGQLMAQASSIPQDTVRLLVREPPNHLADYSTIAATVAAIAAVVLSIITLCRDLKIKRRQQREVDARVSALANAARNGVEGLRENLNLIPNPELPVGTLSEQLESWLTRLDPLMLRLAEEFPAASAQKARQVRSAIGYFYLAAGELRGALWDRAALLKVRQLCWDRLGLLYAELGKAMAPEMIVGRGSATTAGLGQTAHGEGSSGSQKDPGAS